MDSKKRTFKDVIADMRSLWSKETGITATGHEWFCLINEAESIHKKEMYDTIRLFGNTIDTLRGAIRETMSGDKKGGSDGQS